MNIREKLPVLEAVLFAGDIVLLFCGDELYILKLHILYRSLKYYLYYKPYLMKCK